MSRWSLDLGTAADGTANHFDGMFFSGATTLSDNISLPVQIAVASVAISFPTGSSLTTYQVQYSTNLTKGNWSSVGSTSPGSGSIQSVEDTVFDQSTKFYRVIFY